MCKKYIVIILIAVYLLSINAYLVFYAEHQLNLDYIVKYICEQKDEEENLCMGNCYLKKNLAKSDTQQNKAENSTLQIPNVNISPHFNNVNKISFKQIESHSNYYPLVSKNPKQIVIKPATLPPELLSV